MVSVPELATPSQDSATTDRSVPISEIGSPTITVPSPTATVVVPTYNEATNIEETIERIRNALDEYLFEILVIDDDSPDGTWRIVEENYNKTWNVRVVRRTEAKGLSTAVTRGFREALFDVCVVIDADLQHPPEKIPTLLDSFDQDTDLVIGSRYAERGGVTNWPFARQVVSKVATLIAKASLPSARRLSDPLSGFFAVRRDILSEVEFSPLGYKILLELLVRCDCREIEEIPYVFEERRRGDSKLAFDEYRNFLKHLLRLRGQHNVRAV